MQLRPREAYKQLQEERAIPLCLVLNYDQTWHQPFRLPETMLLRKKGARPKTTVTRLAHIAGQRVGLAIVTTSFATGEVGPLFVSIVPGTIPQAELGQLIEECKGHTLIMESCTPSHFMNSEST